MLHSTLWMRNTHTVNNKVPDEEIGVCQSGGIAGIFTKLLPTARHENLLSLK